MIAISIMGNYDESVIFYLVYIAYLIQLFYLFILVILYF